MLWFIPMEPCVGGCGRRFKYILCYGSSDITKIIKNSGARFKYILCYGSSIRAVSNLPHNIVFKYILCYGSSCAADVRLRMARDLNTSYVMVHLTCNA